MADREPIPLTAVPIGAGTAEFQEIRSWPFQDAFVGEMLRPDGDIEQRFDLGFCHIWMYRDPAGAAVGFGTLDVCNHYDIHTAGRAHYYIPLLGVNPAHERRGHGMTIVAHLIGAAVVGAALLRSLPHPFIVADLLFLDVYATSVDAIRLYSKPQCGFVQIEPHPRTDDLNGNKPYHVMARRIALAPPAGGSPAP